jgi:hypothetical protein
MGSQSALAFQPVAALLTEFLQREVIRKECRGPAGAPVAIFGRSCQGFGRPTERIFHSWRLLYVPQKSADSLLVHHSFGAMHLFDGGPLFNGFVEIAAADLKPR